MPLVYKLVARAAGRSLALGGRTILLGLAREAQRRGRSRSLAPLDPVPATPNSHGALVRTVYAAWLCGLAVAALVVLNVDLFLPAGGAVAGFRLAAGAILLVEGIGLVVDRFPFRRLLVARLAGRSKRSGNRIRRSGWPRLVGAALNVLGIVWIAAGVFDLVRGALELR